MYFFNLYDVIILPYIYKYLNIASKIQKVDFWLQESLGHLPHFLFIQIRNIQKWQNDDLNLKYVT